MTHLFEEIENQDRCEVAKSRLMLGCVDALNAGRVITNVEKLAVIGYKIAMTPPQLRC